MILPPRKAFIKVATKKIRRARPAKSRMTLEPARKMPSKNSSMTITPQKAGTMPAKSSPRPMGSRANKKTPQEFGSVNVAWISLV